MQRSIGSNTIFKVDFELNRKSVERNQNWCNIRPFGATDFNLNFGALINELGKIGSGR